MPWKAQEKPEDPKVSKIKKPKTLAKERDQIEQMLEDVENLRDEDLKTNASFDLGIKKRIPKPQLTTSVI